MPRAITARQERAITALLVEPSVAKAAEASGVGLRTLHRWTREDEAFIAAYRAARREAFGHAIGLTQRMAPHAVHTLAKIMADAAAPYAARVAAASSLLRFGRESIETDDLAARVEALERPPKKVENTAATPKEEAA
jgi:hypothetical protein